MSAAKPHFAFPFERGPNGRVATVEQDTVDHIMACEQVIAYCQVGARPERPEFGWKWPYMHLLAEGNVDADSLISALKRFEPRAQPKDVSAVESLARLGLGQVQVDVNLEVEPGVTDV